VDLRTLAFLACLASAIAPSAVAQDGLRLPERAIESITGGSGIDPAFAGGWFSPDRERIVLAPNNWRESVGFATASRIGWSYPLGQHSFGMSLASGRYFDTAPIYGTEAYQYGLFGRYSFAQDWSVSAETVSRMPGTLFRLQDFRIGLRRQF
jgi:hypothetical protein